MSIEEDTVIVVTRSRCSSPGCSIPEITRNVSRIIKYNPSIVGIGTMGLKNNIKIRFSSGILSTCTMLGMNSTPSRSIPEKGIEIRTRIKKTNHNLIRTTRRIGGKLEPTYGSSLISVRNISHCIECTTDICPVSEVSCRNRGKSPGKHDISGGCLKGNINSFPRARYRSSSLPGSRDPHIVPRRTCPSHRVGITIGIEGDKGKLITPRSTRQLYLKWSSCGGDININRGAPARTIPDMVVGVSTIVCDDDDSIT